MQRIQLRIRELLQARADTLGCSARFDVKYMQVAEIDAEISSLRGELVRLVAA